MQGSLSFSGGRIGTFPIPHPKASSGYRKTLISAVFVEAPSRSLYEVLRVKREASPQEIKSAYRTLAKLYHPDVSGGGSEFIEIHEAYAKLSDPEARAQYDDATSRYRRRMASQDAPCYSGRRWETDQCW